MSKYDGQCFNVECAVECPPFERWYQKYDREHGEVCRAYCSDCRGQIDLVFAIEMHLRTIAGEIAFEVES
jgi:hypothetical protein